MQIRNGVEMGSGFQPWNVPVLTMLKANQVCTTPIHQGARVGKASLDRLMLGEEISSVDLSIFQMALGTSRTCL